MGDYFCVNKNCPCYLKPCPIECEEADDGYLDLVCEVCRTVCREYGEGSMMPVCQHKFCRKPATIKAGSVYNVEDSGVTDVYDDIYMCTKHAYKFINKYGRRK